MKNYELIITCVGGIAYKFSSDTILFYGWNNQKENFRIDFTDGSFIEFTKSNIISYYLKKKEDTK